MSDQTGNSTTDSLERTKDMPKYRLAKLDLPRDRDILIEIHRIFGDEYGFTHDPADLDALVEYLAEHADIYHPLCLFQEDEPVGYVRAYDRLSTSSCGLVLMLDLVYVLPTHRGHGLGKILMKGFIDFAAELKRLRIDLLTDHDNPAAIHLYKQFGFQGRDRHQMVLFIKDQPDLLAYMEKRRRADSP
jgi:ribosomal protein S18 acetylase RimI-like enzyme